MELDIYDKTINKLIFEKPEVVSKLLQENGYSMSNNVTLNEITEKTYKALYQDKNIKFAQALDNVLKNEAYSGFVVLAVGAALSIASSLIGAAQARKQRQLQERIAVAKLENDKLLATEQLRIYGEVERTKILANSLLEYRQNLQVESTKREKNVYVYLVAIALGISVIYGTTVLIKNG
jgi:hypothetical protein